MKSTLLLLLTILASFSPNKVAGDEQPPRNGDHCLLPKEIGPCRAMKLRFHFNPDSGKCEAFMFGGCRGNANNFRTLRDCHNVCKVHLPPAETDLDAKSVHIRTPHCLDPPVRGRISCRAFFPRVTFNPTTLKCQPYIYGGCGGTANIYHSEEECLGTCYYGQNLASSPPQERSPMIRGRFGLATRTEDDAVVVEEEENICKLPPVKPRVMACLAFIKKWTHDYRQGKCIEFIYGGCQGTKNLFDSQAECESTCPSRSSQGPGSPSLSSMWIQPPQCQQGPMQGRRQCMAFMPKFTYNATEGRCVSYTYGGCGGSQNLFNTELECLQTCDIDYNDDTPSTVDACGLEIDAGPCRMRKPMYGFNKGTKRCEKFSYGGCGGNDNRFVSVESCVNTCGGNEPETTLQCSGVKCDRGQAMFFQAKGCLPITKPGDCCPSSWDCTVWNKQRLRKKDQCFWADEANPNGKFYKIGQAVPEANGGCDVSCTCTGEVGKEASIICASTDCGFPPIVPGANCQGVYDGVDDCCPFPKCGEELAALPKCTFQNVSISAGQKLYNPKRNNPCEVCICQESGNIECHDVQCGLGKRVELLRGCSPVFKEDVCCPYNWICPLPLEFDPEESSPSLPSSEVPQPPISSGPPGPPPISSGGMIICPPGVEVRPGAVDYLVPPVEKLSQIASSESKSRNRGSMITLPARIDENEEPSRDRCLTSRPPEGGCMPYFERYTFDYGAKVCRAYNTSTEDTTGKFNSFDSLNDCEQECAAHIPTSRGCTATLVQDSPRPRKNDRCLPRKKFRFNEKTGRCVDASRLGCKANVDSYATREECEARCLTASISDLSISVQHPGKARICSLPAQTGGCKSFLRRFHYEAKTGMCRPFVYSGCQGNENNFVSQKECVEACVDDTDVRSNKAPLAQVYLGDPCTMRKDAGKCKAMKPMYFFDQTSQTCKLFYYGGCGGNANKFETVESCQQTCAVDGTAQNALISGSVCDEKPSCANDAWVYHSEEGSCVLKSSSELASCENDSGNAFDSRTVCQAYCVAKTASVQPQIVIGSNDQEEGRMTLPARVERVDQDDPCLMDKVVGKCRAAIRRFFFDKTSGTCKGFFYGGCGGNGNNYASLAICQKSCKRHLVRDDPVTAMTNDDELEINEVSSICDEPLERGPCKAAKPRFFYNSEHQKCERFMYGGCKGNSNNFPTFVECVETCSVSRPRLGMKKLPPTSADTCIFNQNVFNVGDVLKMSEDGCSVCTCSSPPSITCTDECN